MLSEVEGNKHKCLNRVLEDTGSWLCSVMLSMFGTSQQTSSLDPGLVQAVGQRAAVLQSAGNSFTQREAGPPRLPVQLEGNVQINIQVSNVKPAAGG